MSARFLIFLCAGLLVAGGIVFFTLETQKPLTVEGKILKVRTMPSDDKNSIVVVDFRATNPGKSPFMAKEAVVTITGADGKQVEGLQIARSDMDRIFDYYKLLGPKYNEALIMRDRIQGGQTIDRMVAATVALPETDVQSRKNLKLELRDIDGPSFTILEVKELKP